MKRSGSVWENSQGCLSPPKQHPSTNRPQGEARRLGTACQAPAAVTHAVFTSRVVPGCSTTAPSVSPQEDSVLLDVARADPRGEGRPSNRNQRKHCGVAGREIGAGPSLAGRLPTGGGGRRASEACIGHFQGEKRRKLCGQREKSEHHERWKNLRAQKTKKRKKCPQKWVPDALEALRGDAVAKTGVCKALRK